MDTVYLGSRIVKNGYAGRTIRVYVVYCPEEYMGVKGWLLEATPYGYTHTFAVGSFSDGERCLRTAERYNHLDLHEEEVLSEDI